MLSKNLKLGLVVALLVTVWLGVTQAGAEKPLKLGSVAVKPIEVKLVEVKSVEVKLSTDLYQDAQLAKQKGVPIVVMFSQEGCAYCGIIREQFLKPMLRSGDYKNKAIIREVKIDSFEDVRNFDGKQVPSDELSTIHSAYLTPTVVIFDSKGRQHHRILGVTNEHYYGGELDDAIDLAYSRINRAAVTKLSP